MPVLVFVGHNWEWLLRESPITPGDRSKLTAYALAMIKGNAGLGEKRLELGSLHTCQIKTLIAMNCNCFHCKTRIMAPPTLQGYWKAQVQ